MEQDRGGLHLRGLWLEKRLGAGLSAAVSRNGAADGVSRGLAAEMDGRIMRMQ